jgi:RNA polymerase sigma-70 factor (ECF subfamily)
LTQSNDDPQPHQPTPRELGDQVVNDADRAQVFNQYRGLLFSIAYRMLGSVADAEDMLQETFIRWQRASEEEIRSTRAFLVTVISRLCINHLQSMRVQREEYVGQWLPEPVLTERNADPFSLLRVDESLSMAFLVLLERLAPIERAVFLLREVFEYDYSAIAQILGKDEANCRKIFSRARQHVAEIRPRFVTPPQQRERLLAEFLHATASGDMDGLIALLADDAILYADGGGKGPALPNVVHGSVNVARTILGALNKLVPRNVTSRPLQVNGEPGVVSYLDGHPYSVVTFDVANGRINSIYIVTNPKKLEHLSDLPSIQL